MRKFHRIVILNLGCCCGQPSIHYRFRPRDRDPRDRDQGYSARHDTGRIKGKSGYISNKELHYRRRAEHTLQTHA